MSTITDRLDTLEISRTKQIATSKALRADITTLREEFVKDAADDQHQLDAHDIRFSALEAVIADLQATINKPQSKWHRSKWNHPIVVGVVMLALAVGFWIGFGCGKSLTPATGTMTQYQHEREMEQVRSIIIAASESAKEATPVQVRTTKSRIRGTVTAAEDTTRL